MLTTTGVPGPSRPPGARTFLGQPRWFGTLFVVDMWERFSFYGMSAILVLYLVAPPSEGGLGMSAGSASALFGTYMALLFMAAVPGGWAADRLFGPRRATLYGGILIFAGHVCLALPAASPLYAGLALIVAGTGLVKPSMAAMVGEMYRHEPQRREAAFSAFYMSIQLSALVAPLVTGVTAERVHWHLGFGIAAAGMLLGLVHYVAGRHSFGDLGRYPAKPLPAAQRRAVLRRAATASVVAAGIAGAGAATGVLTMDRGLMLIGVGILLLPVVSYRSLLHDPAFTPAYRERLLAFRWMLLASAVFWLLFAQSAALLSLFARDDVRRTVAGFEVPASWWQSVQPLFLLLLAPAFAALWLRLGARVGTPAKFAAGLLAGGVAFVLMALAAHRAGQGPVSPLWLLAVFLLLVCGELAVAPVGLSLAVEVAAPGFSSRVLGLFWLFAAIGAALGGQLARAAAVLGEPYYYLLLAAPALAGAALLAVAAAPLGRRLTATDDPDPASSPALSRPLP